MNVNKCWCLYIIWYNLYHLTFMFLLFFCLFFFLDSICSLLYDLKNMLNKLFSMCVPCGKWWGTENMKKKKTKKSLVEVLGLLSELCCSLEANSLWLIFLVFVVEMENYISVKVVCVCLCVIVIIRDIMENA